MSTSPTSKKILAILILISQILDPELNFKGQETIFLTAYKYAITGQDHKSEDHFLEVKQQWQGLSRGTEALFTFILGEDSLCWKLPFEWLHSSQTKMKPSQPSNILFI